MDKKNFDETFPSLKYKGFYYGCENCVSIDNMGGLVSKTDIQENCIDRKLIQPDLDMLKALIVILQKHHGEKGYSEDANEILNRIIKERNESFDKQKVFDILELHRQIFKSNAATDNYLFLATVNGLINRIEKDLEIYKGNGRQ